MTQATQFTIPHPTNDNQRARVALIETVLKHQRFNMSFVLHSYNEGRFSTRHPQDELEEYIRWAFRSTEDSVENMLYSFERYSHDWNSYHVHMLVTSSNKMQTTDTLREIWKGIGTVKIQSVASVDGSVNYILKHQTKTKNNYGDFGPLKWDYLTRT